MYVYMNTKKESESVVASGSVNESMDVGGVMSVIQIRVPDAEVKVLSVLQQLGEAHAPAIARASNGSISVAAIYKLLGRLEDRGLVSKKVEHVPVGDITARRVFYRVHETVSLSYKEKSYEAHHKKTSRGDVDTALPAFTPLREDMQRSTC